MQGKIAWAEKNQEPKKEFFNQVEKLIPNEQMNVDASY
jgi:hypothetical protein